MIELNAAKYMVPECDEESSPVEHGHIVGRALAAKLQPFQMTIECLASGCPFAVLVFSIVAFVERVVSLLFSIVSCFLGLAALVDHRHCWDTKDVSNNARKPGFSNKVVGEGAEKPFVERSIIARDSDAVETRCRHQLRLSEQRHDGLVCYLKHRIACKSSY
jgi:hypothetical protein